MTKARKPHWVDCVLEKHECWGYDDPVELLVEHEGRTLKVIVPEDMERVHVRVMARSEKLLFLMGRTEEKFNDRYMGVVLIAKHREGDTYEVGVWHELYPYAQEFFGL